jgi:hypothetical protein
MLTAMMSIENMKGADHDVWVVNTDYEYHEEIKIPEGQPEGMDEAGAQAQD